MDTIEALQLLRFYSKGLVSRNLDTLTMFPRKVLFPFIPRFRPFPRIRRLAFEWRSRDASRVVWKTREARKRGNFVDIEARSER